MDTDIIFKLLKEIYALANMSEPRHLELEYFGNKCVVKVLGKKVPISDLENIMNAIKNKQKDLISSILEEFKYEQE